MTDTTHQHLVVRLHAGDADQEGREAIEASVRHVIDYDDTLTNADVQVRTMRWAPAGQEGRTAAACVDQVPWGIVDTDRGTVTEITGEVYRSNTMPGMVVFEIGIGSLYIADDEHLVVAP